MVLFVGTPCQTAGLRGFLNKEYDLLFKCDFICHGVPSPLVFKKIYNLFGRKV
ncbi:Coenzyme F420 hydrogenase/dehydrogenase, beta subunit C-terminal domain [Clostridium saccharoperbutylacetonicum]|uniref:Coenzyme F420 hydrogenase/dehydrogenase, beta subunit C-terminal domain n=1 Tax=Clostridium saccharoperbutylacetonicum TaxID=36745 RepID=UPI0039EC130F